MMSQSKIPLILFAAFACIVTVLRIPTPPANIDDSNWAYITDTALVLMKGDRELQRERNFFDAEYGPTPNVSWSRDGLHIAFLSDAEIRGDDAQEQEVVVVAVGDGSVMRYRCPHCIAVASYADSDFIATSNQQTWLIVPAEQDVRPYVEVSTWTDKTKATTGVFTLVGTASDVLVFAGLDYPNATIFDLSLGNTTLNVRHKTVSNGYMLFTDVSAQGDPERGNTRSRYAVAFRPNLGDCSDTMPVVLFDGDGTSVTTVAPDNLQPNGSQFGEDAGYEVIDLWASEGGTLQAIISTWRCNDHFRALWGSDHKHSENFHRIAEYSEGQWHWALNQPAETPLVQYRSIGMGKHVFVQDRKCVNDDSALVSQKAICVGGKLYLTNGRVQTWISDNVLGVYVPVTYNSGFQPLELRTTDLDSAKLGRLYNAPMVAIGGVPPYKWTSAGLPEGITLDPLTGRLEGLSSRAGEFLVQFSVEDAQGAKEGRSVIFLVENISHRSVVTAISSGETHVCALTDRGNVNCWGNNSEGQLGNGTRIGSLTPVLVEHISGKATAIASGDDHTCVLTDEGQVECWGNNSSGQLGDGSTDDSRAFPQAVQLPTRAIAITSGYQRSCALTEDGTAYCWGNNLDGALGDGTDEDRNTPVRVANLSGISSIETGSFYSCAIISNSLQCWGELTHERDGVHDPTPVSGLGDNIEKVHPGFYFACAITKESNVWCWGYNQIFGKQFNTRVAQEIRMNPSNGIVDMASGYDFACFLVDDGRVNCLGSNKVGQLGNGTFTSSTITVQVEGIVESVKAISSGGYHTCALTASGNVFCWGKNHDGMLGDESTTDRNAPVEVINIRN